MASFLGVKEMLMRPRNLRFFAPGLVLLLAALYLMAPKAHAIPAFSRQYQTSCSTCHIDFQTGLFSIFTAGNFGSDIAFWVDDDISVGGSNAAGGLGDGYLKFVNIGRVFHLPTDALHVRAGQFELDLPFTQARNINLSPYDIYSQANIGALSSMLSLQQNVNNQFTFADAAKGVELSGGHNYGGYHYSVAIVNQNTSGLSQPNNV